MDFSSDNSFPERSPFQGFRMRWYSMMEMGYLGLWSVDYPTLEDAIEKAEELRPELREEGSDDDYQIQDALTGEIAYDSKEPWK